MILAHLLAIAVGFVLDRIIGDPQDWPHPVRWIGSFISKMTTVLNKGQHRLVKGALLFTIITSIVVIIVLAITVLAYSIHILLGIVIESLFIAIGLAQKSLRDAALDVHQPLATGDLTEARAKLSWIVGRDTENLNEGEIVRATVETVSENTADGITSPLFWAFLFGAPGLWLYKTVNTLDSMIGYKDERYEQFGKFSARADDVMNLIPARITGLLMIIFTENQGGNPFVTRLKGWMKDARRHPSPNSGYLEAATAWQLGVTLGGKTTYRGVKSERPQLGPGHIELKAIHIKAAITEMRNVSFIYWLLFTIIGVILYAIA